MNKEKVLMNLCRFMGNILMNNKQNEKPSIIFDSKTEFKTIEVEGCIPTFRELIRNPLYEDLKAVIDEHFYIESRKYQGECYKKHEELTKNHLFYGAFDLYDKGYLPDHIFCNLYRLKQYLDVCEDKYICEDYGKLYFIFGTMGAGKSEELIETMNYLESKSNVSCLALKPAISKGEKNQITSRTKSLTKECIPIESDVDLFNLLKSELEKHEMVNKNKVLKWIFIDECQFLSPKQVDELSDFLDTYNINAVCYGLRTDFTMKLFPASQRLFEIADTISEINQKCICGNKQVVNARFDEEDCVVTEGEPIAIIDDEYYYPMCRKEWKVLVIQQMVNDR